MNFGRAIGMRPKTLSLRSDKGTSLGFAVGRGRPLFALTPSPSPTLWERGVGARGSAPCSAFPLSREAGEGDKGGEGNTARLPVHACAGKNSPCCRDSVPSRCTLVSSCRFPLRAEGTERAHSSVPLAKRGEPKGGGQFIGSDCAIRIKPVRNVSTYQPQLGKSGGETHSSR